MSEVNLVAKPIRSALWSLGGHEKDVEASLATGADAVIIDLEETVPEARREATREIIRRVLDEQGDGHPNMIVRVNPLDSDKLGDDLEAVVHAGLYAIACPLVEHPDTIARFDTLISLFENRAGVPVGQTHILPLLESPQAFRLAYEIGCASSRVAHLGGVSAPGGDVNRTIGFEWTVEGLETLYFRSKVLLDVRAAGVPFPISGISLDEHDLEAVRTIGLQARQLGYTGMFTIYRSHVPIVNEIFSPSAKQVDYWNRLVHAITEAEARGEAALTFEGRFIDSAMAKWAQNGLEMARSFGLSSDKLH